MTKYLIVCLMLIASNAALADGRSVLFLKGIAYGINQECPNLQIDREAIRKTKQLSGNPPGDFYDFMDGMISTAARLKRNEETCDSICGIRPGTCYFMKE